ncbi:hypothetical protein IFM89_002568 [Coptis chinensis]|uniref:Uncharacterized protein n=1 Tax=Coptis chinensis TaxID=261450 RepID=A0A835HGB1_9MAGN|nr:hypothetical protein IFM89_002568 [Coptis chinensis]
MASSVVLRRASSTASTLLKNKSFFNSLRSTAVAPSVQRSFNTNAQMTEYDQDDRSSLDIDRRPGYATRRYDSPASFISDVFDPITPTRSLSQVLNIMDRLMDNPFAIASQGMGGGLRRGWDAKEDNDALHLRIDMPGLGKEDVKVSVEDNTLTIKGGDKEASEEEGGRKYSSRIDLPPNLYKADQIKAEMKNGVLKVSVPKVKEDERKNVHQIEGIYLSAILMADPALHTETPTQQTLTLKEIIVDYTPEACIHTPESNDIAITFDERGGARWRSHTQFKYGIFKAKIQCPKGNTSGLNFNIYLSSLEGDKSQDEIDFEFLGKDKKIVQTNFYTTGTGNREKIHELGFDCSDGFHEYEIRWFEEFIEWVINGKVVRKEERKEGEEFPKKPMFLYSSVWDASYIDEGRWTGTYVGCDAPYVCLYKDVQVPVATAVECFGD